MKLDKILVVEDSQLLQKGYELIFRRYKSNGCKVLHAYNGLEGLGLLADNTDCELIILDVNMPKMTGYEFLQRCKAHAVYRRIPVIMVTTEGSDDAIMSGLEAGADAYLVKPFSVDELHTLIEKIFRARS